MQACVRGRLLSLKAAHACKACVRGRLLSIAESATLSHVGLVQHIVLSTCGGSSVVVIEPIRGDNIYILCQNSERVDLQEVVRLVAVLKGCVSGCK
jgi:hypothetical protein